MAETDNEEENQGTYFAEELFAGAQVGRRVHIGLGAIAGGLVSMLISPAPCLKPLW